MRKKIIYYFSIFLLLLSCSSNEDEASMPIYKINNKKYNAISQSQRIRYIVIHYTHADDETSLEILTERGVSSHYLITTKKKDPIYQLVDEEHRAWHAGESSYDGRHSINDSSIGIEISHIGYDEIKAKSNGKRSKDDLNIVSYDAYYPYDSVQIDKLAYLIKNIIEKYDIHPKNIIGHSDIAPSRKKDPGVKFPWKWLYDTHNIGLWYNDDDLSFFMTNNYYEEASITDIKDEFIKYGYNSMPTNDIWDKKSREVLVAVQSKFRISKIDGNIDKETYSIMRSLNKKVEELEKSRGFYYRVNM